MAQEVARKRAEDKKSQSRVKKPLSSWWNETIIPEAAKKGLMS